MKVEKKPNGKWRLVSVDGEVLVDDVSNAKAWREHDRFANEPSSRQQHVHQWSSLHQDH